MEFDIHRLDSLDPDCDEMDTILGDYVDELVELFRDSPEGQPLLEAVSDTGLWVDRFVYLLFQHCGYSVSNLEIDDLENVLIDVFPRKVTPSSPEDAEGVIPELIAFWEYLRREHNLPHCDSVLKYLHSLKPKYASIINDPSRFGPAKSFLLAGQAAGFDMTDEREMHAFMNLYNQSQLSQEEVSQLGGGPNEPSGARKAPKDKKAKRKMAKAARRKNRKRRK